LPRFLAFLGAAFQQVYEEIGAQLRNAIQSPQLPAAEQLLTGLLNANAARTAPPVFDYLGIPNWETICLLVHTVDDCVDVL
jgi:hypothetical protein